MTTRDRASGSTAGAGGAPASVADLEQLRARPAEVGLDADRLDRLTRFLTGEVDAGRVPGAVALVLRYGRVAYFESIGYRDPRARDAMPADAIFRIYSMTKLLTSIAAMTLVEEGRLALADPLSMHLPEFADPTVAVDDRDDTAVEPARREITVQDLMRQTSGLVGGARTNRYVEAGIKPFDHTAVAYESTLADFVAALGKLPLAYHPGEVWAYGRSSDVLGRVLEVVDGRPLDEVLRDRVLGPLGMRDSGFFVDPADAHRIAQPSAPYTAGDTVLDLTRPPSFLSGGSGGFATIVDYLRVCLMLLGGGVLDGRRVLSRSAVELMAADHVGPLQGSGPDYIPGPGYGFGLGMAVRVGAATTLGSPGELWWLGRGSTCFLVDRREQLVALCMMQNYWTARHYQALFKNLVYQALVD